jgi:hypothetical protein
MKHKEKIKRNIRDLSYLPREDGKRLEEGMFFRSGSLYKASPRFVGYIKDNELIISGRKFASITDDGIISFDQKELGYVDDDGSIIINDLEVGYIDPDNNFVFYKSIANLRK